jgi:ADP-ribose pyrophosphatase YjhB (NUDIX family)
VFNSVKVRNLTDNTFFNLSASLLNFRVSIYGILIEKNHLLVQIHPKSSLYNLPGGKIESGEFFLDALVREIKEETGLIVKPTRLRAVKEDFVSFNGTEAFHTILIFYDVVQIGGQLGVFPDQEDSRQALFVPLNQKTKENMQYVFMDLLSLPEAPGLQ